jgi:hypothetical protein
MPQQRQLIPLSPPCLQGWNARDMFIYMNSVRMFRITQGQRKMRFVEGLYQHHNSDLKWALYLYDLVPKNVPLSLEGQLEDYDWVSDEIIEELYHLMSISTSASLLSSKEKMKMFSTINMKPLLAVTANPQTELIYVLDKITQIKTINGIENEDIAALKEVDRQELIKNLSKDEDLSNLLSFVLTGWEKVNGPIKTFENLFKFIKDLDGPYRQLIFTLRARQDREQEKKKLNSGSSSSSATNSEHQKNTKKLRTSNDNTNSNHSFQNQKRTYNGNNYQNNSGNHGGNDNTRQDNKQNDWKRIRSDNKTFKKPTLNQQQLHWKKEGKCFNCGKFGHYAAQCKVNGNMETSTNTDNNNSNKGSEGAAKSNVNRLLASSAIEEGNNRNVVQTLWNISNGNRVKVDTLLDTGALFSWCSRKIVSVLQHQGVEIIPQEHTNDKGITISHLAVLLNGATLTSKYGFTAICDLEMHGHIRQVRFYLNILETNQDYVWSDGTPDILIGGKDLDNAGIRLTWDKDIYSPVNALENVLEMSRDDYIRAVDEATDTACKKVLQDLYENPRVLDECKVKVEEVFTKYWRRGKLFRAHLKPGDVFTHPLYDGVVSKLKDPLPDIDVKVPHELTLNQKKVLDPVLHALIMLDVLRKATTEEVQAMKFVAGTAMVVQEGVKVRMVNNTKHTNKYVQPPDTIGNELERVSTEVKIQRLGRGQWYFKADFTSAYYLIPIKDDTPLETRSIYFGKDVYIYLRSPMGDIRSMRELYICTSLALGHLDFIQITADDTVGRTNGSTEPIWVLLDQFFGACEQHGLCITPSKLVLVSESVHWCGHILDQHGATIESKNVNGLLQLQRPVNGEQLIKFIGAMTFMSKSIYDLPRVLYPLRKLHTLATRSVGATRYKLRTFRITEAMWTPDMQNAFEGAKELLVHRVKTGYRDLAQQLVVITDASNIGWAGIILQCDPKMLELPWDERQMEPLGFTGGIWNKAQLAYPTTELEGLAIVNTIRNFYYQLDDGKEFIIYSDNLNITYIFDPDSIYVKSKSSPGQGRILRWIEELSNFRYKIVHINGEDNHIADLLSRAKLSFGNDVETKEIMEPFLLPNLSSRISSSVQSEMSFVHVADGKEQVVVADKIPATDLWHNLYNGTSTDFVQPSIKILHDLVGKEPDSNLDYKSLAEECNGEFNWDDRAYKLISGQVIIPNNMILRVSLMVMAHASVGGHRGIKTTKHLLKMVVFWPLMNDDIEKFVQQCIHCQSADVSLVPRPFGEVVEATKRNQILCMDYLHMGVDVSGTYNKALVLTDKLSSYTRLRAVRSENAEEAIEAILDWFACFGVCKMLMSDGGSSFKSEVLQGLKTRLGLDHHVTAAETPWSNGRQERLNRVLGNSLRALLSEHKMPSTYWTLFLPVLQMSINNTPTKVLADFAPISIFCGLEAVNPVKLFLDPITKEWKDIKVDSIFLKNLVDEIHKEIHDREIIVSDLRIRLQQVSMRKRLNDRGVVPIELDIGDFVMVFCTNTSKIDPKWIGSAKIIRRVNLAHYFLFEVEYLVPRASGRAIIHAKRLAHFDLATMVVTPALLDQADYYSQTQFAIGELVGIRYHSHAWEVHVHWDGFEESDRTWEPLVTIYKDAPNIVKKYVMDKAQLSLTPKQLVQV